MSRIKKINVFRVIISSWILLAFSENAYADAIETELTETELAMQEVLRSNVAASKIIVDICAYDFEITRKENIDERGELRCKGIITKVHRGTLELGDEIQFEYSFEDISKLTIPEKPELYTFFLNSSKISKDSKGVLRVDGNGFWTFNRVHKIFSKLFSMEQEQGLFEKTGQSQRSNAKDK